MATEESSLGFDLPLESEGTISCQMSSDATVDRMCQGPGLFSLINKMNEIILSSNKRMTDFLLQQKHVMPPGHIPQEDILQPGADCGVGLPVRKRRRIETNATSTISVNPSRLNSQSTSLHPPGVEDGNLHSPSPSIAGHSETHPLVDDVLSLFGEHDFDGDVNPQDSDKLSNEGESITQDAFLDEIDSATAIAAPKGPPFAEHLAKILNDKFHLEFESTQ